MITRKEILINDLCNEIDFYREEALKYRELYEEYKTKYSKLLDDSYKHSNAMSSIMIKTLLCTDKEKLTENFS